MAGKRFSAEQIIMKLREAEVGLAQGQRVGQVSKQMGVSEQTYYRWREAQTGEEALNGADGRPLHPNLNFASGHLQLEFQGRILDQLRVGFQPAAAHSDIGHNTLAVSLSA